MPKGKMFRNRTEISKGKRGNATIKTVRPNKQKSDMPIIKKVKSNYRGRVIKI